MDRRFFLKSLAAAAVLPQLSTINAQEPSTARRLESWEYRRGSLGGPWEAWRKVNDDANTWTKVQVPHCFNAFDSVEPDGPYYQGPGWYRTRVEVKNPFPGGRTLFHFEGAGQKTEAFVHTDKVGSHVGGYDEFTIDVTDQVNKRPKISDQIAPLPVAVFCDNSRDLEMIPSNLSDFNLYGGLYRYLNLVYVPVISLERILVESNAPPKGKATVTVRARLYNPRSLKGEVKISMQIID